MRYCLLQGAAMLNFADITVDRVYRNLGVEMRKVVRIGRALEPMTGEFSIPTVEYVVLSSVGRDTPTLLPWETASADRIEVDMAHFCAWGWAPLSDREAAAQIMELRVTRFRPSRPQGTLLKRGLVAGSANTSGGAVFPVQPRYREPADQLKRNGILALTPGNRGGLLARLTAYGLLVAELAWKRAKRGVVPEIALPSIHDALMAQMEASGCAWDGWPAPNDVAPHAEGWTVPGYRENDAVVAV